jgi:hypothetical protein
MVSVMVLNATFYNISAILWMSVLLELSEKTADLSQITDKLYHIMLYRLGRIRTRNVSGNRH